MLPRNNADVTHCEKTVFYFQIKAVYRAEDRPTDILGFHVTSKIKNNLSSEVLAASDKRSYRNMTFDNVLARRGCCVT